MPALGRKVKVSCRNYATSATKQKLSRHKSRCSVGILYCTKCPNFSNKSRHDLNYHIAKKHSAARPKNNHTCKECSIEFPSFYSLRHHKQRYLTVETTPSGEKAEMQCLADTGDDNKKWEEELQSCTHLLIDSEKQKGRNSVFNFVVNNLTAHVMEKRLDRVLDKLKCSAKPNLALGFILKNIEDGTFRYFFAHENNTLLEQSKFLRNKDDMEN